MRIGEVTLPASRELIQASAVSVAYAQSLDPADLAVQIQAQNTSAKLRALSRRLAKARARRREAERLYLEEWYAKAAG